MRAQDDDAAAKKFQEVTKAYETLRDPEKRRMYNQLGRENMERMETEGGAPGGGFGGGGPFVSGLAAVRAAARQRAALQPCSHALPAIMMPAAP
jgi:DnaJ-class molecular chaperone